MTKEEGGRNVPVHSGYRGQFRYDQMDWDVPQEFIDKEICNLGESVKVFLQKLSPDYHIGKLHIGQDFEIREGGNTIGRGKITKIIKSDFKYWDLKLFNKTVGHDLKPYTGDNFDGFKEDFHYF